MSKIPQDKKEQFINGVVAMTTPDDGICPDDLGMENVHRCVDDYGNNRCEECVRRACALFFKRFDL